METPFGSHGNMSKPIVRTAQTPSGNKMVQEAKASSQKATGNRLDRNICSTRKRADVDQVNHPKNVVTVPNPRKS